MVKRLLLFFIKSREGTTISCKRATRSFLYELPSW